MYIAANLIILRMFSGFKVIVIATTGSNNTEGIKMLDHTAGVPRHSNVHAGVMKWW